MNLNSLLLDVKDLKVSINENEDELGIHIVSHHASRVTNVIM